MTSLLLVVVAVFVCLFVFVVVWWSGVYDNASEDVRGHILSLRAEEFGLTRRWKGLEPDSMFRKRLLKAIRNPGGR